MSDNIKLVIEISAEMFHEIRDTEFISIETLNTSIKAIENGRPLFEVLDDVKREIKNIVIVGEKDGYYDEADALNVALEIIDKHISKVESE